MPVAAERYDPRAGKDLKKLFGKFAAATDAGMEALDETPSFIGSPNLSVVAWPGTYRDYASSKASARRTGADRAAHRRLMPSRLTPPPDRASEHNRLYRAEHNRLYRA